MSGDSPAIPTNRVGHSVYELHVRSVALSDRSKAPALHVQVQRRGHTLCGRVCDMSRFDKSVEPEWFKVKTAIGTGWFPATNLRLCSHVDGRCVCGDDATGVPQ